MLISFVKLTARKLRANFVYSLTTISGLSVGITTAFLVFLWVRYEVGYDHYDPDNNRVFAVMTNEEVNGSIETYEESPSSLTGFLDEIPEVEAFTRIDNTQAILATATTSIQRRGMYADSGYFQVFNPVIVSGAVKPLLNNNSIAVSQEVADLLFPGKSAIGNTITVGKNVSFNITAVFRQFPNNSSLAGYSFVLPYGARARAEEEWENHYVKLSDAKAIQRVQARVDKILSLTLANTKTKALLFPLTDWRLHWNFENGKSSGGRIVYVVIFTLTAVFILVMACVNYINIATANAVARGKEIGVRKMTGASRLSLVQQFLFESFLTVSLATVVSIGAIYLLLPVFSELCGVPLAFSISDPVILAMVGSIIVVTSVAAGSYPAFLLSSLKPASVMKGHVSIEAGPGLRQVLVVFQFCLSVVLIFSAVIVHQQTKYLLGRDLGFDKENVINIWINHDDGISMPVLKNEILRHHSIVSAAYGGASPIEINGYAEVHWDGEPSGEPTYFNGASTDADMLAVLKFKFIQGRNFSGRLASDSNAFVITESAARKLGYVNPIGQTITYTMFGDVRGPVIGVIEDFQNDDIHIPSSPVVFTLAGERDLYNLFVRYQNGKHEEAIAHIRSVFRKLQPGVQPEYTFLDEDFERQLYQERLLGRLSLWFTVVAVVIAVLGLIGLAIFSTVRRTKEIGVRKVLGATAAQIVVLLTTDYLKPVFVSLTIALPLGYWLMSNFLQRYPVKVEITAWSMAAVALLMFAIVFMAISYQSLRAATRNPVDSIRRE